MFDKALACAGSSVDDVLFGLPITAGTFFFRLAARPGCRRRTALPGAPPALPPLPAPRRPPSAASHAVIIANIAMLERISLQDSRINTFLEI